MLFKIVGHTAKNRGSLVLIGGAEDRRDEKRVLKRTLLLNETGKVAVIPTASDYPKDMGRSYIDAFSQLGVNDIQIVDVRSEKDANDEHYVSMLKGADLVFFTGGNQEKLVRVLKDSAVLDCIRNLHIDGATIAGTSAGAAAASNPMVAPGGDGEGFAKGSIIWREGFGFVKNVTFDTHFVERGRISRLSQWVASGVSDMAIGLAEDTGVIITPDNKAEVIGSGIVTVLNGKRVRATNYYEVEKGKLVGVDGIRLSFFVEGMVFDLRKGCLVGEETTLTAAQRTKQIISEHGLGFLTDLKKTLVVKK